MALKLSTPEEFTAFPFVPYEIQFQLMQHLYSVVEDGQVSIVESPTGTVSLVLLQAPLYLLKRVYLSREKH